ncbi:MAG: hypothetical protein M0R21_04795 [Lentimicrobiaceae bacterium]|nr:hypothetical protein [Lentimicrobiaceae bacterium]
MYNFRLLRLYSATSLFFLLSVFLFSCNKNDIIDDNPTHQPAFSTDTVIFDTVFTTLGSSTRTLMVYNNYKNSLNIKSIHLMRGESSPFRINIDGNPALNVSDIEIAGKDSLYIFVKVTINPNNTDSPLIQSDSLLFETNGKTQYVKLVAWGQDAHFYNNAILGSDYTFTAAKPHVIYGSFTVDSLYTLTIEAGAKVYFHNGAFLLVRRDGTLKVDGTKEQPIIFRGDRLEDEYANIPAQWDRIWLSPGSKNNRINYAVIINGTTGIQADTTGTSTEPTLVLDNTLIYNMGEVALLAQGSYVRASNSIFGNCGKGSVFLRFGGNYDFRHCTIGNYWNYTVRQNEALVLNNYYYDTLGNEQPRDLANAYFGNCIIFGNQYNEVLLDNGKKAAFIYQFENCLMKTNINISNSLYFNNCIKNEEPWFTDVEINDFALDTIVSAAVNKGNIAVINSAFSDIRRDINGVYRIADGAPDLGAYEFVPEIKSKVIKRKSISFSKH